MKIFSVANTHDDARRTIVAFHLPPEFPRVAEAKVLTSKQGGVVLGNHSHTHYEGFFLVQGACTVLTWTEAEGVLEHVLQAPAMFMFEPGEEHRLTCSKDLILVGYMPVTYEDENNTRATHLG